MWMMLGSIVQFFVSCVIVIIMMICIGFSTRLMTFQWTSGTCRDVQKAVTTVLYLIGQTVSVIICLLAGLNVSDLLPAVAAAQFITLFLIVIVDLLFATFPPEDR